MARDPEEPLDDRPELYAALVAAVVLVPMLSVLISLLFTLARENVFPYVELGLTILLLTYYISSIKEVKEQYAGGIYVLQQYSWEVGPGYYFVPRFLSELNLILLQDRQNQFPGNPEQISMRPDNDPLHGLLRPFRTPTAGTDPGLESADPLSTRLTLEPTASVVWRLRKRGFFQMWNRIPGNTWEEKDANILTQMYDSLNTDLGIAMATRTPAQVVAGLKEINCELETGLEAKLSKFGVDIDRVEMQPTGLTRKVNQALEEVGSALARRQAALVEAEGQRQAEILRQSGIAEGRERLAEADFIERQKKGEGDMAAARALGMAGSDYRAGEIAIQTVGEADLVLGVEGITQAVGLGRLVVDSKDKPKEVPA
ncbi:MAG TPA: SPFH domain-containing protein [Candidatus Paceibacterota bacterium]|nr:SPFH domain-containing protein [Candidatus Paceibacterota bacterium]